MMTKNQNNILNVFKSALLVAAVAFLPACGAQINSDLEDYMKDVKLRVQGQIEPLPRILPPPTVEYAAQGLREPFTSYEKTRRVKHGPRPIRGQNPEALEAFPLDTLSFVGLMELGGHLWGLVQAPDQSIHRVSVGNHLGENYGAILEISESNIILKEIVSDGLGRWIEREASLALTE